MEDLHIAVFFGVITVVAAILKQGDVNVNKPSGYKSNYTPLQWASMQGHVDVMSALIDAGAAVETSVDSPLSLATDYGNLGAADLLLAHGAKPTTPDKEFGSPLHLAAACDDLVLLRAFSLTNAGLTTVVKVHPDDKLYFNVDEQELTARLDTRSWHETCFRRATIQQLKLDVFGLAVLNGSTRCVAHLLEHGVDHQKEYTIKIDAWDPRSMKYKRTEEYWPAIYLAAATGHEGVTKELLKHHIHESDFPLYIAMINGRKGVADRLRKAGFGNSKKFIGPEMAGSTWDGIREIIGAREIK